MNPRILAATFLTIVTAVVATGLVFVTGTIAAAEPGATAAVLPEVASWGLVAAALATGLSALGAAYAVAHVGSAAVGALAEKPELLGKGPDTGRPGGGDRDLRPDCLDTHPEQAGLICRQLSSLAMK